MNDTDCSMQKKILRAQMLEKRRQMPFDVRAEADAAITRQVLAHPAYLQAQQIFAYVSMPHEVSTRALLKAALADGKTVGLPVCIQKTRQMHFYRLDSLEELRTGAYRIPVPPDTPDRLLTADERTLVLVPMLAIDRDGYRLGAGGGFYDRWLAANPVQCIGICYAGCCAETLPHDRFDQIIPCCITEQTTEEYHGKA